MAEPKVGDRISLDAKKVGQPRRGGVVRDVRQGLSGVRLEIEWDDGARSVIAPGAGVLQVEGRTKANGSKRSTKPSKPGRKGKKSKR